MPYVWVYFAFKVISGTDNLRFDLWSVFHLGKLPASFRFVLMNAFDAASWKIVAANTVVPEERRRFTLALTADF